MYKITTLLALCTVFTLSSCAVGYHLLPPGVKAGIAFVEWVLRNKPPCLRTVSNIREEVPKWICSLPRIKTKTGAYGLGIAEPLGNLSLQYDKAQIGGRLKIAATLQAQIVENVRGEDADATRTLRKSFEQYIEGTVYGSYELANFQTADGTIYSLMAITDEDKIKESAEGMIQRVLTRDRRDLLGCQDKDRCASASRKLWKEIDDSTTIEGIPNN